MSGSLAALTPYQQIETLYIAYFGRAADAGGAAYWLKDYASLTAQGLSPTQAVVNMAASFAVQPEAVNGPYTFFADPAGGEPVLVGAVVTAVYHDLFNRAPDAAGEAYWSTQILTGAISIGAAIYDIANGAAVGSIDAGVLGLKIEAAAYFTEATGKLDLSPTYQPNPPNRPAPIPFIEAARDAVMPVYSAVTEASSQSATDNYLSSFLPITGEPPAIPASAGSGSTNPAVPSLASLYPVPQT